MHTQLDYFFLNRSSNDLINDDFGHYDNRELLATESEMAVALASISANTLQFDHPGSSAPPAHMPSKNLQQAREQFQRALTESNNRQNGCTVEVPVSNYEDRMDCFPHISEVLRNRFIQTSRDQQLISILQEYGSYVKIQWKEDGYGRPPIPLSFTCCVGSCDFSTFISEKFIRHMRTSFDCNQCPKRFHTKKQLEEHETEHSGKTKGAHLCDDCGKCFRTSSHFNYHKHYTHKHCTVCHFEAVDIDEMACHLRHQHYGFGLTVTCDLCGEKFLTASQMGKHRSRVHLNGGNNDENEGTSNDNSEVDGDSSIGIHRRVMCQICGKMLSSVSMRVHLLRFHNKVKRFQCQFCVIYFYFLRF